MTKVRIEVEVRPTEDLSKVIKAVRNVVDIDDLNIINAGLPEYKILVKEVNSLTPLTKLHDILRRERILDAARSIFFKMSEGNQLVIKIHKQAAFAGRLSFVTDDSESPMGPIKIIVESSNIRKVIDWLAPKTSEGKPLWEHEMPED